MYSFQFAGMERSEYMLPSGDWDADVSLILLSRMYQWIATTQAIENKSYLFCQGIVNSLADKYIELCC